MKKLLNLSLFVLVLLIGWQVSVQAAHAGTNLTVVCNNEGPCTTSPNAPLFSETNLVPGETRSQTVTIINNDSGDTCQIGFTENGSEFEGVDLSEKFYAAVTDGGTNFVGIVSGGSASNALSFRQLFDTVSQYNLGILSPGSSRTYTWLATFDKDAGNEYQGLSTNFEIVFGFTCNTPSTSPPGPASSSTSSNNGGGGGTGGGDTPQSFSVLGVVTDQALAFGGQILGTGTDTSEITEMTLDETPGEVAGAISDVCSNWKQYLPWILLVVQVLLILCLELLFRHRRKSNITIWALAAAVTMVSIALFYLLRECNCFTTDSWQYRLCQWYWLVAVLVALCVKFVAHKLLHDED